MAFGNEMPRSLTNWKKVVLLVLMRHWQYVVIASIVIS